MGASGWHYFVPYQEDVEQALQALRGEVFARGEYERTDIMPDAGTLRAAIDYLSSLSPFPEQTRAQLEGLAAFSQEMDALENEDVHTMDTAPDSIETLLEWCAENGTHSILDIERVSDTPDFCAIAPLPDDQLLALLGTTQPTRETLGGAWIGRVEELAQDRLYERWQGIYFVVYADGVPAEIYIEGCSGD